MYEVRLKQFEGPLDLLLHLIEKAEVDIKDIFISEITSQYLGYMKEVDELDMDTASEFLAMAANIVYIKSRSLLPKPPKDDDEEDPEQALIRQLTEYRAFKQASAMLEELTKGTEGMYTRLPEEFILPPQEFVLTETSAEELREAFLAVLKREHPNEPISPLAQHVSADRFTVRMQLVKIRRLLFQNKTVRFEELFEPGSAKLERIVTFMALLEMLMYGEIHLKQRAPFEPITLTAGNLLDNDSGIEYTDEQ
jgi:segregation and condensation protein A